MNPEIILNEIGKIYSPLSIDAQQEFIFAIVCVLTNNLISAAESCGGGIIYSDNESYQWI